MGRCKLLLSIVIVAVLLMSASAQALLVTLGSDADTYIRDDTNRGDFVFMDLRGNYDFMGYLRFDLSSLSGATVQSASLTLTISGGASRNDTVVPERFALNGLNDVVGNTPQDWGEMNLNTSNVGSEYGDPLTNVTDLDGDVPGITETIVNGGSVGGTVNVTGDALVAFLQGRIDAGSLATFILEFPGDADRGYGLATKENATVEYRPKLELEYIPEPATIALLGLGGLSLLRKRR